MDTIAAHRAARAAHEALVSSLQDLERAQQNAVLRFADILHEEHFRALGFPSILHYATEALGFSQTKAAQFLRLAKTVKRLPALEKALENDEIGWTKAREVGKVATVDTQDAWIEHAKKESRRELERDVREAKKQARAVRAVAAARLESPPTGAKSEEATESGGASQLDGAASALSSCSLPAPARSVRPQPSLIPDPADSLPPADPPVRVSFELTSRQLAEFEKLMEKLQRPRSKTETLLTALHALAAQERPPRTNRKSDRGAAGQLDEPDAERDDRGTQGKCTRVQAASVQIVVYRCDTCQAAMVPTSRGNRRLSKHETDQIPDDARILAAIDPDCSEELETTAAHCCKRIPEKLRQKVLARDGHRCRRCDSTRHLDVHHKHKRSAGGGHSLGNCTTLCRACHVNRHFEEELLERGIALERERLIPLDSP